MIFFNEKEGTTPLVQLLDGFDAVSIVHHVTGHGLEPFEVHNCGPMTLRDLDRCLRLVYGPQPVDMDALNRIYTKTALAPLEEIRPGTAVGFKMRFRPPSLELHTHGLPGAIGGRLQRRRLEKFRRQMLDLLAEREVLACIAVRQDILRWSLSKYHGDGTGRPGHIQFALAAGSIGRSDLPAFHVELSRLDAILTKCRLDHERKRRLQADLEAAGIRTAVLRYEDFLADRTAYFQRLLGLLDVGVESEQIVETLDGIRTLGRVHPSDISEFVENHAEVLDAYGDAFVPW
jgi:hypothetical protein